MGSNLVGNGVVSKGFCKEEEFSCVLGGGTVIGRSRWVREGGKNVPGRVNSPCKSPEVARTAAHSEGAEGRPEVWKQG